MAFTLSHHEVTTYMKYIIRKIVHEFLLFALNLHRPYNMEDLLNPIRVKQCRDCHTVQYRLSIVPKCCQVQCTEKLDKIP